MSADVIACAVLLFVFVLGFLCGYGKAMEPERKAAGGYGSQADDKGRENCNRERIWFSPACIKMGLFD